MAAKLLPLLKLLNSGVPLSIDQQFQVLEALPKGPDFIDNAQCRCTLQATNVVLSDKNNQLVQEAWRCTGNGTNNEYAGASGKWFAPKNLTYNPLDLSQPEAWAGNPPDLARTYLLQGPDDRANGSFVLLSNANKANLSSSDAICTGQISPSDSAQFYSQVANGLLRNSDVVHKTCFISQTVASIDLIPVQNVTANGCPLGFICQNSSAIIPPQVCTPILGCQQARLGGRFCGFPQGYFEPMLCPEKWYCPPGGKLQLPCPQGSFCPLGSTQPQKCGPAASCPPLTSFNQDFLPLIILIIVDVIAIGALIFFKLKKVFKANRAARQREAKAKPKGLLKRTGTIIADMTNKSSRYGRLHDEEIPFESRIVFDGSTAGYMAQMEPEFVYNAEDDVDAKPSTELQLFVQSLSRCMDTSSIGLSFEFEGLEFRPKKSAPYILSEVTGTIPRGSFCAVMGGSGAGKSTFVNVLMGKAKNTGGVTKVNGIPGAISKYKKVIGYVPQDDIVLPELTVRENILHSARIRLPATWSDSEVQHHVDVLLACLQLTHVKNSLVGSPGAPVISGGQRKRVSIGMELAAAPMALFLDEPTSGLDATSASSIMSLLKTLSKIGITIVAIIHQPREEIYESLDELTLLGKGRMLFQGNRSEVQTYFENLGFNWPPHTNPADVVMDIIAGQGQLYKKSGDTSLDSLIDNWKACSGTLLARRASSMVGLSRQEMVGLQTSIKKRGAYWWSQIYFCFMRSLLQQWRTRSNFFFEIGTAILAGLLGGLTQLSSHGDVFRGFFLTFPALGTALNYTSVLQVPLIVGLSLGLTAASPAVKLFGEEKLIYWREAASGHSRFAYYIGKVCSALPRIFLASLHYSILFYVLATPLISWFAVFISNLLYYYTIYGLATVVSMLTKRENGPLLAVLAGLVMGLINGVAPTLATVKGWGIEFLWRSSPGVWLAEVYFSNSVNQLAYLYDINLAANQTGYTLSRYGLDLVVIFLIGTGYRIIAFGCMVLINRSKQR